MKDKIETDEWSERLYGVPLLGGLLAGVVSFVVGYLTFLGLAAGTGDGFDFDAPVRRLKEDAHTFYNSFLVPTYERQTIITEQRLEENGGDGQPVTIEEVTEIWRNPFTEVQEVHRQLFLDGMLHDESVQSGAYTPSLTFPVELYLAVPVVVLFAVGLLFGYRYVDVESVRIQADVVKRSLVGGGTVTLGFLLVALVGTFLFRISGEGFVIRPDRVDTIVYGLAYAAVVSTAGITVGQLLQRPHLESSGSDPIDGEADVDNGDPSGDADDDTDAPEESENDVPDGRESDERTARE